jgi:hypothetical protein
MTGVGGNWVTQNKVRPGAYINFKSVPEPLSSLGTRGVMTMPLAMSWGATVTELFSTDLLDGTSIAKVGYDAFDEESLIYREPLSNCYKAIIYRLDTGGVKATAGGEPLTATALYTGTCGNKITVAVVAKASKFNVITFYNGIEKDRQLVATIGELVDNDFVIFSGTSASAPVANAGTALTGGTNGTVAEGAYTAYFAEIQRHTFNTMAIPSTDATLASPTVALIKNLRDEQGVKVQAVLYDYPEADHEGIISVNQGYTTDTETISPATFVATIAGLTAGAEVNQSLTNQEFPTAKLITGELTNQEIIDALNNGQMVLSKRQDGTIKIEQDINTFVSETPTKGYVFRKNRIIRCLDEINNSTKSVWEGSYMGKVDNNANGRNIFKADLIYLIGLLQSLGAIENFDGATDITISQGTDIDAVVVDLALQPVDSMEKLYMTVSLSS